MKGATFGHRSKDKTILIYKNKNLKSWGSTNKYKKENKKENKKIQVIYYCYVFIFILILIVLYNL